MFNLRLITKARIDTLARENAALKNDIENAVRFINNIENSIWHAPYSLLPADTEKTLAKSLIKMRDNRMQFSAREEERTWATDRLSNFSNILRSSASVDQLADNITRTIIQDLKANQGALFILNDQNPNDVFLEMKGLYAYDKKKYQDKKIFPGEGVVGQCFLEGEMVYLKDVPETYVKITSGLGGATPTHVILSPLKSNGITIGILELISFEAFKNHQLDFLKTLTEAIARTIINVKGSENTAMLLKESETLTLQLKIQEENMRENIEKITIAQDDLQKKNKELESARLEIEKQQSEIDLIQKREMELVESKLQTQQMIHQTTVLKLKEKIKLLQEKCVQIEKIQNHLN